MASVSAKAMREPMPSTKPKRAKTYMVVATMAPSAGTPPPEMTEKGGHLVQNTLNEPSTHPLNKATAANAATFVWDREA